MYVNRLHYISKTFLQLITLSANAHFDLCNSFCQLFDNVENISFSSFESSWNEVPDWIYDPAADDNYTQWLRSFDESYSHVNSKEVADCDKLHLYDLKKDLLNLERVVRDDRINVLKTKLSRLVTHSI